MQPLRCIIVDDEKGAHLVLEHYLNKLDSLQLMGSFFNGIEAINFLHKNQVDLVFLDINMPGLSGLDLLGTLSHPPLVILTTAYTEFALESYKYQVVDYLVKPFEFPRFLAAVNNAFSRIKPGTPAIPSKEVPPASQDHLIVKVDGEMIKVFFDDIYYIQSMGNYVKVHTRTETLIYHSTTNEFEQKLDKTKFKRIHKSYIVALKRIKRITNGQAHLENDVDLPIGITFRRELLDYFQ